MAVSPIDGRYYSKTSPLGEYFSEYALIRCRVRIEMEYFISLCEIPLPQLAGFDRAGFANLRAVYQNFSLADAQAVKDIEKITNHDVKAVEYFVKGKFQDLKLDKYVDFIHFGLTSQDINNTATPLLLREAVDTVYLPNLDAVIGTLKSDADKWKDVPMLAHTHGQPASPTRLGKELMVFVVRLEEQRRQLASMKYPAKFGGATGNFNAHAVAYPDIDWNQFARSFVEGKLCLSRSYPTTQIEHYDNLAAIFDCMKRINTILIDFCRDMWTYISMEYFKQMIKVGEVGSSTMPHKVNPIDYENAEGNLGMANAVFMFLSGKLPLSRMQRDLTDSTVLRNVGVPIAHTVIALKSIRKGLDKLLINEEAISRDLDRNWAVVAEGIQTILRREGYPNPYETLKDLTRINEKIDRECISKFIDSLNVSESVKDELRAITPETYVGI
jgi:adenylosuccinate lyase